MAADKEGTLPGMGEREAELSDYISLSNITSNHYLQSKSLIMVTIPLDLIVNLLLSSS